LFLPTQTCNPKVTKVRLALTFAPEKGDLLDAPQNTLRMCYDSNDNTHPKCINIIRALKDDLDSPAPR
jgi:hypothetical protein